MPEEAEFGEQGVVDLVLPEFEDLHGDLTYNNCVYIYIYIPIHMYKYI